MPAGSSLTTIAGSTAGLKWDPRLTQLIDWLSNYRLSIIILFLFSPGEVPFGAGNWGWVCKQQQQPCHLTCVGAESLPVLLYPVPAGTTQCLNPFCGHGTDTREYEWYVRRNASMSPPPPQPAVTELPPQTYEFLFLAKPIISC